MQSKSLLCAIVMLLFLLLSARPAQAVNWFILQGVEAPNAPKVRFGGFLLLDYQNSAGGDLPAGFFQGQPMISGQVAPNFRSSTEFNLRKLQLGLRGALTDNVNYCIRTISGNNSATHIDESNRIRLVEASITLNYLRGARMRLGLFKTPGTEESMGFIPPCQYINLTRTTETLMQERFFSADGADPLLANEPGPASCCRDIGAMVFDAFDFEDWELSYAAMLGNGHGIQLQDKNSNPDIYLYLSAEWLHGGGKDVDRQGWKFFGWYQEGQRVLEVGLTHKEKKFHRSRYGIGTNLLWDNFRLVGELVKADGMIFVGTDAGSIPGSLSNNGQLISSYNVAPEDQALGWYVDLGYQLVPNLWLNGRYDRLNLGTETTDEKIFTTWTLGTIYRFSPQFHGKINYEWRYARAPRQDSASTMNQILANLDPRFALQLIYLF
jgi:hypothetical protein